MSTIGGERRVQANNFAKKVGLFQAKVICVNPDVEAYKDILGIELKEDSKATEYLGTNADENQYLRVDIWVENVKKAAEAEHGERFPITFFLEDKERENKDQTKKQYINDIGSCTWSSDAKDFPTWFVGGDGKTPPREYRVAYNGEEELYTFLRTWLSELDYRQAATTLQIEWKKLMKGNVKDIEEQINGEWCSEIVCLATVKVKEVDGEMKELQRIWNKGFLPSYALKNFRLINYSDPKVIQNLKTKKMKDMKPHEKFVVNLIGEYGCKDYYSLGELENYDPSKNMAASNSAINAEDDTY